ncbi:UPF0481 protein [Actinidia chinensis var. chinensis]|uniref:UPF0481 protein n=1 Tax=Actinidia chinensis var. chinensis TaxID=1590841 RepID=A0A2R6P7M8_ACTCC|nr:UPF0481 protein [Actinidia chinensis var. chinensis]
MAADWVIEINKEGKRLEDETSTRVECQWKKRSIYKLPACVTDLNKNAYLPQVVSFGPYHHGEEHLMPMEEHKKRALFHFLKRTKKPFQIIVDNLTKVVQDLKDSYDLLGDVWQSDTERFLKLMVLDGCFMLEVLYYYAKMNFKDLCYSDEKIDSFRYDPSDPIFCAKRMLHVMNYIRRDMLLLENQLPMQVLIELVAGICPEKENAQDFVNKLTCWFTKSTGPDTGECLHVLDIFRKSVPLSHTDGQREHATHVHDDSVHHGSHIIVSAMEIQEAGIRFKVCKSEGVHEISFKDGVLHLPLLCVDDTTESVFLNLIAFERLHVGAGNEVTSYFYFMNGIINSVEDVVLLQSHGVIHNALKSHKAVIELFKLLGKDIMFEPNKTICSVLQGINEYRNKPWVQYREKFAHAYHLSTQWNPWAYISIIFAILLFTLTLVQTAYTISPYYHPNK